MTNASSAGPALRGVSLPAIAAAALCVFLIVLTFLAWNLKIGHDPALRTYVPAAQHVVAPAKGHVAPALVTKSSGGG